MCRGRKIGDIWCYLTLICPYFMEGTGRNRLDDTMWTKRFCDFLQIKFVTSRNGYKADKEVSMDAAIEFVNVYYRRWFNKN